MPFTVLVVCTGNVCRSPMAELLMRAWAAPGADLEVHSAGTQALVGHRVDRGSAVALRQLGVDPTAHRARQFEPWMAADADLVLTAERAHRDAVLTEVPTAFRRTFTLREFARLASYAGPGPAGDVVAQAAASRPAVGAVALEDDDVPDPYRRQTRHAVAVAEQVSESVHTCLDVLGLLPRGTGSAPRRTHGA